ncbi:MAG: pyridoxal-dependent decarboxylase [Acidobacteriota bacterium]
MAHSTFDFDLDEETFRQLGHRMIDLMAEALAAEHQDPVLRKASGRAVRQAIDGDLPRLGRDPDEVFAACREAIFPYCRRNGHPRFFGYVSSSADPIGVLADGLISALNQNVTAWRSGPAATTIERQVVRWLDEMVGFAGEGHGLLTSGGSAANFQGLATAVRRAEERAELASGSRNRLTLYVSSEGHLSMAKAGRLLGLAEDHIRKVAIDTERRLRIDDLERQLAADLADGLVPAAICLSAGTANTGAIDPLDEAADVAERHDVWLHIDGAYGAPAAMVPAYRWLRRAFGRADSLSLDPHKWLYVPLDSGCVLYRDEADSHRAFSLDSEYIAVQQTDPAETFAFFHHSPDLSRRFRALKLWMILKVRGVDAMAARIGRDIALRQRLDEHVRHHPNLEHLGSELSISCFRYVPDQDVDPEALNTLNRHILETLLDEGQIYMSPTTLDGRYSLRICIVNFRTTEADIDFLLDEVVRLGSR